MFRIFADNVVLPTAEDGVRVAPARVEIVDGVIVDVAPMSRTSFLSDSSGDIDLGARLLAPSFTNGHTHLAMSAMRGLTGSVLGGNVIEDLFYKVERHLTPSDVRAFARMGALDCLMSGCGAVFEHYYGGLELARALHDVGLTGVVALTLQDRAGPGSDQWREQLRATVELALDDELGRAGVVAALGPHATDTVSAELWSLVADAAERHDLPVHMHVAQSIDEVRRSYDVDGAPPVEALLRRIDLRRVPKALLVHGLYVSDAELDLLDPAKVVLGYCPLSQLLFEFPVHIQSWQERGFSVLLGTDAGACNDAMDVQRELALFASGAAFSTPSSAAHGALRSQGSLRAAEGVRAHRAQTFNRWAPLAGAPELLRSVWQVPGDFHPGLAIGRVAVGCRANLAAWDLSHPCMWPGLDPLRGLAYGSVQGALHSLWVNGQVIGEIGDVGALLRRDDVRAMVSEASERLRLLLGRI